MPITLVATVGSASANSYVTQAEADSFADELLPEPTAWQTSNDVKARALITATRRLDHLRYIGSRVDAVQALEWPRSSALKPGLSEIYLTTEIPAPVKRATMGLALWLVAQVTEDEEADPTASDMGGLSAISLGSELSMTFEAGAAGTSALTRFMREVIRPILGSLAYAEQPRVVRG